MRKETGTKEEQYSSYVYGIENAREQSVILPKELLRKVDINPEEDIDIECSLGMIVITPNNILGRIPEELMKFYKNMGFSREVVETVIGGEAKKAGGYDRMIEKMRRTNI